MNEQEFNSVREGDVLFKPCFYNPVVKGKLRFDRLLVIKRTPSAVVVKCLEVGVGSNIPKNIRRAYSSLYEVSEKKVWESSLKYCEEKALELVKQIHSENSKIDELESLRIDYK